MVGESVINQEDAEEYTQALGQNLGGSYRQILLGKKLGVPQALGLTVEEWVTGRLGGYVRLTVEDRRAATQELTDEGLSQRETAEVLGVSPMTVGRDLHASSASDACTLTNVTEEPEDPQETVTNVTPACGLEASVTNVTPRDNLTVICGDALTELRKLPDDSVQCCVTSPPYWGLRDYGTARWEGGSTDCDHVADPNCTKAFGNPEFNEDRPSREDTKTPGYYFDKICGKCGAVRTDEQLGLEATPELYVAKMVEVFREVRRVLRDDGTLWLNLGDCYSGGVSGRNDRDREIPRSDGTSGKPSQKYIPGYYGEQRFKRGLCGLKTKDLCGIPWSVALALRDDGWYLRSDIIWHKSSPMPESVNDRPTKAHEYIFLLSKSKDYYYDAEAIQEPSIWANDRRKDSGRITHGEKRTGEPGTGQESFVRITEHKNRRSVWQISTTPYPGAHFATFPEELPRLCILAGSKSGDTILDPFAGSGTTGKVALELKRSATLIELNPEYIKLIGERCALPIH